MGREILGAKFDRQKSGEIKLFENMHCVVKCSLHQATSAHPFDCQLGS